MHFPTGPRRLLRQLRHHDVLHRNCLGTDSLSGSHHVHLQANNSEKHRRDAAHSEVDCDRVRVWHSLLLDYNDFYDGDGLLARLPTHHAVRFALPLAEELQRQT